MKKILLSALLLPLAYVTKAQTAEVRPPARSLLWRITGGKLKQPSYLFGTAHLICPDQYKWTNEMKGALDQCSTLCLEMNITDQAQLMQVMASMTDSVRKLQEWFAPAQYAKVARYFSDSLHTDLARYSNMKPIALVGVMEEKVLDCPKPVSYEYKLLEAAQQKKMKVTGLEDGAETIAITAHITPESVVAEMQALAEGKSDSKSLHRQILDAYSMQDIGVVAAIAREELKEKVLPLLDNRNQDWVKKMPVKMQEGSVFFAVGAGHLAGPDGLIHLLREAGYVVEPVR
jgi:uncharacterized protein YbaP (TraB family)